MAKSRTAALGVVGAVAAVVLAGCITVAPEASFSFGQGSARPACRATVDPARVPTDPTPVVVGPGWSDPVELAAPVTDPCPNDAIAISPDGATLYFYWAPVVNGSGADLLAPGVGTYRAERVGDDPGVFGEPTFFALDEGVTSGSSDGELSFTPDGGSVIFQSARATNLGYNADPPRDDYLDLYAAPLVDGVPGAAEGLGAPIDTIYLDGEAGLNPDGSRLYVASDRPGGFGALDLWVASRTGTGWGAGAWGVPVNGGAPLNTAHSELQPAFAADDPNTMYFVSDRDGPSSIYRTTWDGTNWSAPEMVITGSVGDPALVADGSVLYFVQILVDDAGMFGSNIWYVTRTN